MVISQVRMVHAAGQKPQSWSQADATNIIRSIARSDHTLHITKHASDQMSMRDLTVGDVLYVLKSGFVHTAPQKSTRKRFFKYSVDSRTPNSGNRILRVVVLPSTAPSELKLITIMWRDEDTFKA